MTGKGVGAGTLRHIGAEMVLALHFCFVAFAIFGGFLGFLSTAWLWFHVPVVAWSAIINLSGWTCPLTPLEKALRRSAGLAGYEGGFITHYLGPLVYPRGMPRQLELIAAVSIIGWNSLVYAAIFLVGR